MSAGDEEQYDPEPIVIPCFRLRLGELEEFAESYGTELLEVDWESAPAKALTTIAWIWLRRDEPSLTLAGVRDRTLGEFVLDFTRSPRAQSALREAQERGFSAVSDMIAAAAGATKKTPA